MKVIKHIGALVLIVASAAAPVGAGPLVVGNTNDGNSDPFGFWNFQGVYQQVYSSVAFSGPINISSLTFYAYFNNAPYALRPGPFNISLSTTAAAVGGLNPTLANNIGPDETLVYSGTTPAESIVGGKGQYTFFLSSDFTYNPSAGNLLLTVTNPDAVQLCCGDTALAADDSGSLMSRGLSPDGLNATLDSDGLVTGFNGSSAPVPEPASAWMLFGGIAGLVALRRRAFYAAPC